MATGPMIHATLIPISHPNQAAPTEDNMLVISTHYSVTDGWSMGVLFRDLSRAYNMLKLGEGTSIYNHCHLCEHTLHYFVSAMLLLCTPHYFVSTMLLLCNP